MEGASIHGISSYISRHDRLWLWSSWWYRKSPVDTSVPLSTLTLSVTYLFLFQQVDDPAPTISRSGRPIELLQSGPISLIGHNAPSLSALMHHNIRFKKTTSKWSKVSPSVAATLAQAFKVNSWLSLFTLISSPTYIILSGYIGCDRNVIGNSSLNFYSLTNSIGISFLYPTYEILVFIKPKGLKHLVPMPPAQSSSGQEKGSEKHQDPAKASEDNTILSISSSTSDLGINLSSSTRALDARSAFPFAGGSSWCV